jgi:hypothetical protein
MKLCRPVILCAALFTACAPGNPPVSANTAPATHLTAAQKASIGRKIWQNESGGTVEGLTAWNVGEEFPSLGIGHFIWYPAGFNGRFKPSRKGTVRTRPPSRNAPTRHGTRAPNSSASSTRRK